MHKVKENHVGLIGYTPKKTNLDRTHEIKIIVLKFKWLHWKKAKAKRTRGKEALQDGSICATSKKVSH